MCLTNQWLRMQANPTHHGSRISSECVTLAETPVYFRHYSLLPYGLDVVLLLFLTWQCFPEKVQVPVKDSPHEPCCRIVLEGVPVDTVHQRRYNATPGEGMDWCNGSVREQGKASSQLWMLCVKFHLCSLLNYLGTHDSVARSPLKASHAKLHLETWTGKRLKLPGKSRAQL